VRAITARVTRGMNVGSKAIAADNSGARIVRITGVVHGKTRKGRQQFVKVGDWVKISVRAGKPEMKGLLFDAVVIRQKMAYQRLNGERVAFEDNAVALLKDEKGNPKGTMIKGAVAREVQERWKEVAKLAQFVL